ncbi:MAG: hypothetical protein J4F43_11545 [Dehalococcoidia bacterium]|nr:hypothetical protein [Dehalococcoidia bacterium]
MTTASGNLRYEVEENPPLPTTLGLGLQFAMIASATLLVTPVIVARESGRDESYLVWMVFASLVVVGVATLLQVRRLGLVGAGTVLPMFTAAFAIPFCITAVADGGPATLTTLVLVSAVVQIVISKWLFILRRIVTPTVGGTVMMILSITLASVVFGLLDRSSEVEPVAAPLTALTTLIIVAALTLRGSAVLRLWGPLIGIVGGCIAAAGFGIYDIDRVIEAPWIGLPTESPGLGLDFSFSFWSLLPAFLFLGIIISIQTNGAAIAMQRVSWRDNRAVDFRAVQRALAGTGVTNLMAGVAGAVPNIINPGIMAFTQITGVASRRVGYCVGVVFIVLAFLPKASGLLSTIPGPVMTGYLILITGTLFVDGARTVIETEENRQKVVVAGVCFWIGAAFQFGLFDLPNVGSAWGTLLESGVTTGGVAAIVMILYLEFTNPRRMRFRSRLHIDALPELNEFIARFAARRGWDAAMKDRLSAAAEETLLTLAPLDLSLDDEDEDEDTQDERQLVVVASSDGPVANLEFIGGGNQANIEDQVRQLQQHDIETPAENELSLRLLRSYASSVQHQQYHDTDIITLRVSPPEAS